MLPGVGSSIRSKPSRFRPISTLPRHAYEADAILIGGYGFGDEHVNSVLSNMLRDPKNDRPRVLVLDHDEERVPKKDGESLVERMLCNRCDGWTYNLQETLQVTDRSRFEATDNLTKRPCGSPMTQMKMEQFEISSDAASQCSVAVWFGGFDEANARLDQIAEWLKPPDKAAQPTG